MNTTMIPRSATALILSSNWDVKTDLSDCLEDYGVASLITDNFDDIPYLYLADFEPSYLFVSVDEFGGPAVLYDRLRGFRDSMPNTAIILISSEFSSNEYGTHRLQLADVSLRYPFSRPTLLDALKQAPINLSLWKKRILESVV